MKNSLGREIPESIKGYKDVVPFKGAFDYIPEGKYHTRKIDCTYPSKQTKIMNSIEDAIREVELKDGMTVSFHHHLRNGDYVINTVISTISKMGIRDIKLASTALFPIHREIIPFIKDGTITRIESSLNGPVGRLITEGFLEYPVTLRSHGGRARAIYSGDLEIDVAFIAAPSADIYGNISGLYGPSACGSLGYAFSDARHAKKVIAITDTLLDYPISPISIPQTEVDIVVKVDQIGDPKGIVSGTTRITKDPTRLKIAEMAAELIKASGLLRDGFSFQTGAGGISLAVAKFVRDTLKEKKIKGSFGLGGITGYFVEMLKEGLFRTLLDVQCFDLEAVKSLKENATHQEISADFYANPHNKGCIVNMLDSVILGATEIDLDFNVNVNTEFDGALVHGIGGHQDTAAGAKLTIVVSPLLRGRIPTVTEKVLTVTTPGETIDAFVSEYGIAINPRREELIQRAKESHLPLVTMEELLDKASRLVGKPDPLPLTDKIIGVIEYRDGTVIDVVRAPEKV